MYQVNNPAASSAVLDSLFVGINHKSKEEFMHGGNGDGAICKSGK